MKTEKSTFSSAEAALKKAIKSHKGIGFLLEDIQSGDHRVAMPLLRERLGDLTKSIHEFNAYQNVLETD